MLAKLRTFPPVISLTPQTGVQFLDFGFNSAQVPLSCSFLNAADTANGQPRLVCLYPDSEGGQLVDAAGRIPTQPELIYSLTGVRAAETFLQVWLPVPFLRIRETRPEGGHYFADGPTNWARIWLTELPEPDREGNTHRVILAFDTQLMPVRQGRPYLAPSPLDMEAGEEFALAAEDTDALAFARQEWVEEWLHQVYYAGEARRRAPRPVDAAELRQRLDPIARYLTLLALLAKARLFPRIRFTYVTLGQTATRHNAPIDVDLALDIGNSRTCGILMETSGDEALDFNDSYRLELRDLTRPEQVYDEPFPSRVEFARGRFGDDALSRRSGRASAFLWPTAVRVGAEAQALSYFSQGTEGGTGLSTPKRYLWDTSPRRHEWRFNPGADDPGGGGPVTAGPFVSQLREDGEERAATETPAVTALFSRSALMTFFLSEILLQTWVLINSPARRYERRHAEAPRRLRRVILTLPTALPLAERRLFVKRAQTAIRLTWRTLDLDPAQAPEALLQWDEATGTQLVFLYNEIRENFQGDTALFFQVFGKPREDTGNEPSLRIASIDVGGGTTDLIITTYRLEGGTALNPTQEFREGFNLAGDDVLNNLIERNLFPSLLQAIQRAGAADPGEILARCLGGNRGDQPESERTLRKQFANQIALPLALHLLHRYENADLTGGDQALSLRFADVFAPDAWPHERVTGYLEEIVRAAGGGAFRLAEVSFETTLLAIDNCKP